VNATCLEDCNTASELSACQSEARAALTCTVARPASDWECDEDGEAALAEGVCENESNALLLCAFNADDGLCPFENDGECDDPSGTDSCEEGTDVADCSQ
jgi:hypothetical protein